MNELVNAGPLVAPPRENRLLASLPPAEYDRLVPSLQRVRLAAGSCVCETQNGRYAYFPTGGVISLVSVTLGGEFAELAVIGAEGVVGVPLLMTGTMPTRAVAQTACSAYRLSAGLLQKGFAGGGEFQRLILRYVQSLLTQISLTAVCNRHHSVEQKLCRWLLQRLERLPSGPIGVTQELIATMLGVRRQGIAEATSRLQRRGAIESSRGAITVVSRKILLAHACECYGVSLQETRRLLPAPAGAQRPHAG